MADSGDEDHDPEPGQRIGCWRCYLGWRHGCCDDICRANEAAEDCSNAIACVCNPHRETV